MSSAIAAGGGRGRRPGGRGRHDADLAACGPPHDRSRLLRLGLDVHRQLFLHAGGRSPPCSPLASAGRYYFVVTLGERVVADLRKRRLRPCHRAVARLLRQGAVRRDRVAAGRRHDADQVGGRRHRVAWRCATSSSGSARSAMMVVTSPKLSGLVIAAIPVIVLPLVAFGRSVRRRSRAGAGHAGGEPPPMPASRSARSARCRPSPTRSWSPAGFRAAVENAFAAARSSVTGARLAHLLRHLHGLRLGGGGAVVRLARRADRRHVARHARPVPALFGVRGRRARRAVGGRGASCRQAAGAAERLDRNTGRAAGDHGPGRTRRRCPRGRSVRSRSATSPSPIRRGPTCRRCTACALR